MRDNDTKSYKHELKLTKQKQKQQFKMLLDQEQDFRYPKNKDANAVQKKLENQFFSELAKKAAAQEIHDIMEERKLKLTKAMSIKEDWDMNINFNRLKNDVFEKPQKFYTNFDYEKNKILGKAETE